MRSSALANHMTWQSSIDQMGNKIELANSPARIVSLVPSQTELLYDLGLDDRVVGITKFCVHPPFWLNSKAIVGGTKNFQIEAIGRLQPDLIIGNKEENDQDRITKLQKHFPVWMSDIENLREARSMINSISMLTDCQGKGIEILKKIEMAFSEMKPLPPMNALYLMWRNPWMGAGRGTFIHEMMTRSGLVNALFNQQRYPKLSQETMKALNPALVLLSSEPFPFLEKHIDEVRAILPHAKIMLVDGEMFSWYGSRLMLAPTYFSSLSL